MPPPQGPHSGPDSNTRGAAPSVAAGALQPRVRRTRRAPVGALCPCPSGANRNRAGDDGQGAERSRPAVPPWRGAGSPWQRPAGGCHWLRRCHGLREPPCGGCCPGAPCVSGQWEPARGAVRGVCAGSGPALPLPCLPRAPASGAGAFAAEAVCVWLGGARR